MYLKQLQWHENKITIPHNLRTPSRRIRSAEPKISPFHIWRFLNTRKYDWMFSVWTPWLTVPSKPTKDPLGNVKASHQRKCRNTKCAEASLSSRGSFHTLPDTGPPHKVQQQSHLQHVPPNHSSALPTFNLRKDVVTCIQRQLTVDTNIRCPFLTLSKHKY